MMQFDHDPTGQVLADEFERPGSKMAAEDMAMFMLDQLADDTWLHKAPFVASKV
jgi:hypothetical protein